MKDLLYLSLQYIRHHRMTLMVLTFAITLVSWLPIAIQSIVDQTAEQLLARADRTPLGIGAPGSALELALGSPEPGIGHRYQDIVGRAGVDGIHGCGDRIHRAPQGVAEIGGPNPAGQVKGAGDY